MALPPYTGARLLKFVKHLNDSRISFSEAAVGLMLALTAKVPLRQPVRMAHQPEPIADIERRFGFAVRDIGFRLPRPSGGRDL
jgi:hypothetical protein